MLKLWHMQMHGGEERNFSNYVPALLEHKRFIGLGEWKDPCGQIRKFCDDMQINDIVAIKNGKQLIALVQVIGKAYEERNDTSMAKWLVYRRPIRILDWADKSRKLPTGRMPLQACVGDDKETSKVIAAWYDEVKRVLADLDIPLTDSQ
ncbi:pyruvate kinase [Spirabiliibacterium mucosae]|uniref:pyruvate kinase n=1 Tax=Spirabiliibacterium mucosae TaxID=28156 RepID=UPI0031F41345